MMDQTPFSALYDVLDGNGSVSVPEGPFEDIIDESLDKVPSCLCYDESKYEDYVKKILSTSYNKKEVDLLYSAAWTRFTINRLLLDILFKDGHFTLGNLLLMAKWDWNNSLSGNLAAFYDSTVETGNYLFDLGIKLDRYFIETNKHGCYFEIEPRNKLSILRKCPDSMRLDPKSWIIFVPFDDCRIKLGGSALSKVSSNGGGAVADQYDPDYFIDCYEVIREMIEDGIVIAGRPIGRGGLAVAAEKFRGRNGFTMDIGSIMASTNENDSMKILFSEAPGVLLQIMDSDYDYFDSQMLLQETAYYPLGHPDGSICEIRLSKEGKNPISGIVDSLLGHASEGED